METSRPASRSPASAAPTCRKSTEPMYESLVTLRRAHQLSARRASMTLCHGCDPRGAREWCGRWSKAHNRRSAIVGIPTGDPTSCAGGNAALGARSGPGSGCRLPMQLCVGGHHCAGNGCFAPKRVASPHACGGLIGDGFARGPVQATPDPEIVVRRSG